MLVCARGLQSPGRRPPPLTGGMSRLFNGEQAAVSSPESAPPRARGDTDYRKCHRYVSVASPSSEGTAAPPPPPGKCSHPTERMCSGVLDAQQDLSVHLPWHLLWICCLLLPYHLTLASHQTGPPSPSFNTLCIYRMHFIRSIHRAPKPHPNPVLNKDISEYPSSHS